MFTLMNVCGFPSRRHYIEFVVFAARVALPRMYLSISVERLVASYLEVPEITDVIHVKAIRR